MPQNSNALFIDKPESLARFCDQAGSSPWLALDTEFVRERTYYPQLCLIQVATEAGQIACIDTLAIEDLSALHELLADSRITNILHAVSQDLEVFYLNGSPQITSLFDTQIAAGLLGLGDQIGYAGLVKDLLDVELAKGHARTDWSRRPLSAEQLVYAADDVRYLGALYTELSKRLEDAGRLEWLYQDVETLSRQENFQPSLDSAWRRLKGLGRLPADAQHRAARLAAWREQRAIDKDRPRRWILGDAPLLELAHRVPGNSNDMANIRDLPEKLIQQQGAEILQLLSEKLDSSEPLVQDWARPDAAEKATLKRLKATLKQVAEGLDISPTLLATRSDIEGLVQGRRDVSALQGWRSEVVGKPLLAVLEDGQPGS